MTRPPIIAVSTLPRVGSMWAFNVARQLAMAAGYHVTPAKALQRDEDMLAAAEAFLSGNADNAYCILKVHMPLFERVGLKVIYLQRDLRDRIFSICRFDQRQLNEASVTSMVRSQIDMDAHYDTWQNHNLLRLPYAGLENDSLRLIQAIASFMELQDLPQASLENINENLSKKSVGKMLEELTDQATNANTIIRGSTDAARIFDANTGFQTGHVSDYQSGDWEHLWTAAQRQLVDQVIRQVTGGK